MSLLLTTPKCSAIRLGSCRGLTRPCSGILRSQKPILRLPMKRSRNIGSLASYQPFNLLNTRKSTLYMRSTSRLFTSEPTEAIVEQTNVLPTKDRLPRVPLAITAISLVPYVACTLIPFAFPFEIAGKALFMQMTYGAVSLSMLGSVHWGLAMADYKRVDDVSASPELVRPSASDQILRYVGGTLPALASWIFLSQAPLMGMMGLMASFTALALFELGAHQARLMPSWYVRMRVPWTATVLACLGINLIHLL